MWRRGRATGCGNAVCLSAGRPGADWWVAGPAVQDVELDAVAAFYDEHGLWDLLV